MKDKDLEADIRYLKDDAAYDEDESLAGDKSTKTARLSVLVLQSVARS